MVESLTRTSQGRPAKSRSLEVLLISDGRLLRFPLPESGSVTIGRSSSADISADDQSISRMHARIDVGSELHITDLGSKNGTEVRGVLLAEGTALVRVDEPFVLGDVTAVVQHRRQQVLAVEVADAAALDKQFVRTRDDARRMGQSVSVLRVHPKNADRAELRSALAREFRSQDHFLYDDGALTAVVRGRGDDAEALTDAGLAAALARFGGGSIGTAHYPEDGIEFETLVERADQNSGQSLAGPLPVVEHPSTEALYEHARKIARGDIAVLVLGETGVGKEVLATAVHRASPRTGPLVRVNCAAHSDAMLENELFGHGEHAFSGANEAKIGAVEAADEGTLFLDDIGGLPSPVQARLMEFLESGSAVRVGETEQRQLDVRVIAATSTDLSAAVAGGHFRRDLFYRLSAVTLEMPPLRERTTEIVPLAERFLREAATRAARPPATLTEAAARRLKNYEWPGNVRELRNVIEHALLLSDDDEIESTHIAFSPGSLGAPVGRASTNKERDRIITALDECAGNQTRAARVLGISRRTLVKRLDEYDLPRPQKK